MLFSLTNTHIITLPSRNGHCAQCDVITKAHNAKIHRLSSKQTPTWRGSGAFVVRSANKGLVKSAAVCSCYAHVCEDKLRLALSTNAPIIVAKRGGNERGGDD